MRDLLRASFLRLERDGDGYRVVLGSPDGTERVFASVSAPEAYGLALLSVLERVSA